MPIYQFRNLRTGQVEEHFLPVARRDCVAPHLQRITVPVRVGTTMGLVDPNSAAGKVPKAFRQYEEQGKDCRTIERETGFSREHIRRVWDF